MFGTSPLAFSVAASSPGKPSVQEHGQGSSHSWWDIMAGLSPSEQRPIAFTTKGIIVAHPYHPILTLQPFPPMQNERLVDFPVPINVTAHEYGPPKAIAVSSKEDLTFAFFPSLSSLTPGICCIWDGLKLIRHWPLGITGDGVVGCWWLGQERQTIIDNNGHSVRLPSLGPKVARWTPTLLILSESFNVQVVYIPLTGGNREFQGLHINALHKGSITSAMPVPNRQLEAYTGHICVKAAVGLAYNNESIILALQTALLPPATIPLPDGQNMNLSLPTAPTYATHAWARNWELNGQEPVIRLCELKIGLKENVWTFESNPLPSLPLTDIEDITHLTFIPAPPPKPPGSPTDSIFGQTEEVPHSSGLRYLVVSSISYESYTSNPRTTLTIHSIDPSLPSLGAMMDLFTRDFEDRSIACLTPARPSIEQSGLLVSLPALGNQDAADEIRLLTIPELADDTNFQPIHVKGGNILLSMCISPTGTHIAATTPKAMSAQKKVSIYQYPSNQEDSVVRSIRNSIVRGALKMQDNTHVYQLVTRFDFAKRLQILYEAIELVFLEEGGGGNPRWERELVKELLILLRVSSSMKNVDSAELEHIGARLSLCIDVCSLLSIRSALQDYKSDEEPHYHEDSIWPMLSLSSWALDKIQQLWRAAADHGQRLRRSQEPELVKIPTDNIVLLLLHPVSLDCLVQIINGLLDLKKWVEGNPEVSNKTLKGKEALRDLLSSGLEQHPINLAKASGVLSAALQKLGELNAQDLRRVWIFHEVQPTSQTVLESIITQMLDPQVVDILTLYVQPDDMIIQDQINFSPKITQGLDIITKTAIQSESSGDDQAAFRLILCGRCGGKSQHIWLPGEVTRWKQWERSWLSACICGGKWQS